MLQDFTEVAAVAVVANRIEYPEWKDLRLQPWHIAPASAGLKDAIAASVL